MKHSLDYLIDSRPVVGLDDEYPLGFVDPMHCHDRAQLLYTVSGAMTVTTHQHSYVVPPRRALWLPAGTMHEVAYRNPASLRTLYIDPAYDSQPTQCRLLEVSDFLGALILEAVSFGGGYLADSREGLIIRLLLGEIGRMPAMRYYADLPQEPRLLRICRQILATPGDPRNIDDWAQVAGMSRRTFTRLFQQELGTSFAFWRQQVRLMEALSRLAAGQPVASVAFEVGYESPSAFTAMFTRAFGQPPSHYAVR